MNTKMHGAKLKNVYWPNGELVIADDSTRLHLSATYHGDHDEFWIVQTNKHDMEVARYNIRYVESFAWDEPTDFDKKDEDLPF